MILYCLLYYLKLCFYFVQTDMTCFTIRTFYVEFIYYAPFPQKIYIDYILVAQLYNCNLLEINKFEIDNTILT